MISKIHISETLASIIDTCDESQKQQVRDMLDYYMLEYSRARTTSNEISAAASIHDFIDELIKAKVETSEHTIQCSKGCSFCCYQQVDITIDEAKLLRAYAIEKDIKIDKFTLKKQLVRDYKAFQKLPLKRRKCVFLGKNGECSVYEHRPSACRKLLVVTDPLDCDTEKRKGAQIGKIAEHEVEIVTSAILNAVESGSIAEMLLKL